MPKISSNCPSFCNIATQRYGGVTHQDNLGSGLPYLFRLPLKTFSSILDFASDEI